MDFIGWCLIREAVEEEPEILLAPRGSGAPKEVPGSFIENLREKYKDDPIKSRMLEEIIKNNPKKLVELYQKYLRNLMSNIRQTREKEGSLGQYQIFYRTKSGGRRSPVKTMNISATSEDDAMRRALEALRSEHGDNFELGEKPGNIFAPSGKVAGQRHAQKLGELGASGIPSSYFTSVQGERSPHVKKLGTHDILGKMMLGNFDGVRIVDVVNAWQYANAPARNAVAQKLRELRHGSNKDAKRVQEMLKIMSRAIKLNYTEKIDEYDPEYVPDEELETYENILRTAGIQVSGTKRETGVYTPVSRTGKGTREKRRKSRLEKLKPPRSTPLQSKMGRMLGRELNI